MTRIRVNPQDLIQKSADLTVAAVGLRGLGDDVKQAAESAPSYDGQFCPLVSAIGWTALIGAKKNSNHMADHSSDLVKRASSFIAADQAGVLGLPDSNRGFWDALTNMGGSVGAWLVGISDKLKSLIQLGNLNETTALPVGFVSKKETEELGENERLVNELLSFQNSPEGREMMQAALAAGLLFIVYDKNGNVLAKWGKEGGQPIPITFGSSDYEGEYFPADKKIVLNQENMDKRTTYKHTLIHEMQHAIDDRNSKTDDEYKNDQVKIDPAEFDKQLVEEAKGWTVDQLEKDFATYVTGALETEVNAFDIGFSREGGIFELLIGSRLDRTDGVYTKDEFETIFDKLDYEEIYENNLNGLLRKAYPNGPEYSVDVWLDNSGKVQVDIKETLPITDMSTLC